MEVDRRDFLKIGGCALAFSCMSAAGAPACKAAQPFGVSSTPEAVPESYVIEGNTVVLDLTINSALKSPGSSLKFSLQKQTPETIKILVFCTDNDVYRAVPDSCTHGGMELEYKHNERVVQCVSFGKSAFDLNGKVLKGPAPKPLTIYPVSLKGNKLFISLK